MFEMKRRTKVNLSPLVRDGVGSKPSFGDFQDVYRSFDIMLAVLSYISDQLKAKQILLRTLWLLVDCAILLAQS